MRYGYMLSLHPPRRAGVAAPAYLGAPPGRLDRAGHRPGARRHAGRC